MKHNAFLLHGEVTISNSLSYNASKFSNRHTQIRHILVETRPDHKKFKSKNLKMFPIYHLRLV